MGCQEACGCVPIGSKQYCCDPAFGRVISEKVMRWMPQVWYLWTPPHNRLSDDKGS